MRRSYKVSSEQASEIRKRMNSVSNITSYRRLEAVALLGEGHTPDEVARIKQYSSKYVRNLGLEYHRSRTAPAAPEPT